MPVKSKKRAFAVSALTVAAAVGASTLGALPASAQPQVAAATRTSPDQITEAATQAIYSLVVESTVSAQSVMTPATSVVEPVMPSYSQRLETLAALVGPEAKVDPVELADVWKRTDKQRMTAVIAALGQVGDPYLWGSSGPDSFDCSGLVSFA